MAPSITLIIIALQEGFVQKIPVRKCKTEPLGTAFSLGLAGKAAGGRREKIWDILSKWTHFYFPSYISLLFFILKKNLTLMK